MSYDPASGTPDLEVDVKTLCSLAAAVAALAMTASPQARTTHHRWNSMTLTERRAVVVRDIGRQGTTVHWWVVARHRSTLSADYRPLLYCRSIGIRGPGFVCAAGQRLVHDLAVRKNIDAALAARDAASRRAELVRSHYAGWLCIHAREGAWNANTGNGYYGGLQMTPGWGGLSRPDLASPATQIATAESQASLQHWSYSWMSGQWPNTYPPCASYFGVAARVRSRGSGAIPAGASRLTSVR